jgi:hypothetical protein
MGEPDDGGESGVDGPGEAGASDRGTISTRSCAWVNEAPNHNPPTVRMHTRIHERARFMTLLPKTEMWTRSRRSPTEAPAHDPSQIARWRVGSRTPAGGPGLPRRIGIAHRRTNHDGSSVPRVTPVRSQSNKRLVVSFDLGASKTSLIVKTAKTSLIPRTRRLGRPRPPILSRRESPRFLAGAISGQH